MRRSAESGSEAPGDEARHAGERVERQDERVAVRIWSTSAAFGALGDAGDRERRRVGPRHRGDDPDHAQQRDGDGDSAADPAPQHRPRIAVQARQRAPRLARPPYEHVLAHVHCANHRQRRARAQRTGPRPGRPPAATGVTVSRRSARDSSRRGHRAARRDSPALPRTRRRGPPIRRPTPRCRSRTGTCRGRCRPLRRRLGRHPTRRSAIASSVALETPTDSGVG